LARRDELAAERSGKPPPARGIKMGKSLVTGDTSVATGEVIDLKRPRERSAAKEEVGSFERHPNAPDLPERDAIPFTGGVQYVPDEDGYW
jgi:hypothetical protein